LLIIMMFFLSAFLRPVGVLGDGLRVLSILHGESRGDQFGISIANAGDVNGDGYDDILVGAGRNSEVSFWAGKVYLYLGGSQIDTTCDLELSGEFMGDGFGTSVCISPDVNGDSYGDLIIGAPYFNTSEGSDVGKVYVYFGGLSMDPVVDVEVIGELLQDIFGYSIASGDVDGDNLGNLIIGALNYGGSEAQMGRVYLFCGGIPFDITCDFWDTGLDTLDGLGFSLSAFGQFTYHGDGSGGFAAGAWNMNGRGAVKVYGSELIPASAGAIDLPEIVSTLEIFPNPSTTMVMMRIRLEQASNVEADLYDISGRRILQKNIGFIGPGEEVLDLVENTIFASLKPGVYFLRVKIGKREFVRKVLIMK